MKLKMVLGVLVLSVVTFVGCLVNLFIEQDKLSKEINNLSEKVTIVEEKDNENLELTAGIGTILSIEGD